MIQDLFSNIIFILLDESRLLELLGRDLDGSLGLGLGLVVFGG
jgi:hypothetical protein